MWVGAVGTERLGVCACHWHAMQCMMQGMPVVYGCVPWCTIASGATAALPGHSGTQAAAGSLCSAHTCEPKQLVDQLQVERMKILQHIHDAPDSNTASVCTWVHDMCVHEAVFLKRPPQGGSAERYPKVWAGEHF